MAPASIDELIPVYYNITATLIPLSTNDIFTDAIQAQFRSVLESLESWWVLVGFSDAVAVQFSDAQREQIEELLQEIENGLEMIDRGA